MFQSQLSDHPQESSFVLVLLILFQPDRRSKQAERVVIALAQRTTPEDGQITTTEICRVFNYVFHKHF
jgi:hypothetical protein